MSQVESPNDAAADSPVASSDSLYELAYNAATEVLKQQDGTLTSVRNRASGLLATAALVASFSTAIGIIKVTPSKAVQIPQQYGWALLATFVLTGVASSAVLLPIKRWAYGPDPDLLIKAIKDEGLTAEQLYSKFTPLLTAANRRNARKLMLRVRCYQAATILLVIEVGILIIGVSVS